MEGRSFEQVYVVPGILYSLNDWLTCHFILF